MGINYAQRVSLLKTSEIRELLKVTENREIISLGGGLPAPELFPIEEIIKANAEVLKEAGQEALQYASTEGYTPLRKWISKRMADTQGAKIAEDQVLITSGSQQALDLTGKIFLDEGDVVLCESPTYMAAISAFRIYGCAFEEVPTDEEGMRMEALEKMIQENPRVKMIYAIPNFQNPSGRTWSLERRRKLAELAARYQIVVIEDNPYGELRFEGTALPSVQSFDRQGYVMYLGTFSKIYCPGYRIGWIAGNQEIVDKYIMAKQGADLQCNTLAQREIHKYLEENDIDLHIEKIRKVYRKRKEWTIALMERYFPKSVTFTNPQGGLFLWVTLPQHMDSYALLEESIKQSVTFVPGGSFFPNSEGKNYMRINFSNMSEEKLEEGIKILGRIIEKAL